MTLFERRICATVCRGSGAGWEVSYELVEQVEAIRSPSLTH
jgi:hypothetical protein